jgi:putative membrane protein
MVNLLGNLLLSAVALLLTSYFVPGFRINSFGSAIIAAVVIGLLNWSLRPILFFLTLPINILTMGLFTFVVNAIILKLAAAMLSGLDINSWLSAIFGAVVLAILHMLFFVMMGS